MTTINVNEIDQERYIHGSYDNVDWELIYFEENETITSWLKNLDKTIHTPFRLAILSVLYKNKISSFAILKQILNASSGNLNNHLNMLNQANLIKIQKLITESKQKTIISISEEGLERYEQYVTSFFRAFQSHL